MDPNYIDAFNIQCIFCGGINLNDTGRDILLALGEKFADALKKNEALEHDNAELLKQIEALKFNLSTSRESLADALQFSKEQDDKARNEISNLIDGHKKEVDRFQKRILLLEQENANIQFLEEEKATLQKTIDEQSKRIEIIIQKNNSITKQNSCYCKEIQELKQKKPVEVIPEEVVEKKRKAKEKTDKTQEQIRAEIIAEVKKENAILQEQLKKETEQQIALVKQDYKNRTEEIRASFSLKAPQPLDAIVESVNSKKK